MVRDRFIVLPDLTRFLPRRVLAVFIRNGRACACASTPIRFTPIRTADLAGSRSFHPTRASSTIDDGSFPTDLRYRTLSLPLPHQRGNKRRGSLPTFYPDSGYHARSVCGIGIPVSSNLKFHRGGNIRIVISNVGEKETRRIRDKVEIRGSHEPFFLF